MTRLFSRYIAVHTENLVRYFETVHNNKHTQAFELMAKNNFTSLKEYYHV